MSNYITTTATHLRNGFVGKRGTDAEQIRMSLNRQRQPRSQSEDPARISALQGRLKELLVFELLKDGGREYRTMTLRTLYNHVLGCITATKPDYRPEDLIAARTSSIRQLSGNANGTRGSFTHGHSDIPQGEKIDETEQIAASGPITYRERLGGYLHPRDMRRLVTPFSASNEPELIVRRHVMLLNFDPLRAIVLRDRLLVLVPDGADSILIDLEKRVRGGMQEMENSVFGDESQRGVDVSTHSSSSVDKSGSSGDKPLASDKKGKKWTPDFLKLSGGNKDKADIKSKASSAQCNPVLVPIEEGVVKADPDDFQDDFDEFNELNDRKWIDLPFELQCVDAVLQSVVALLSDDAQELQLEAVCIIESLLDPHNSSVEGDSAQETLRRLKNAVGEMAGKVQGFIRAMNLVLDDDEDLSLMNLSRLITHPERFIQPVPVEILHEESDEPELILEAFLQQGLSIANALELLKGIIGTTNELVSQKLDSVRNRLLYVNTVVSLLSLCVAVASLVGSYFGMNLANPLETDPDAFKQVVTGTTVGVSALAIMLFWSAWFLGALPKNI